MLESGLYLKTKLHLAPQMQFALRILQMPAAELNDLVQAQAMENPLISLEHSFTSYSPGESEENPLENCSAHSQENTLRRSLQLQIPPALPGSLRLLLLQLIDCLEPSGYLREPREELCAQLEVSPGRLQEALALLQSMDPPGVGASTLAECLLLQLQRLDASPLACQIARRHLEDVAAGRLAKIAREEGASLPEVRAAVERIRSLSPYPASGYDTGTPVSYVAPDIFVTAEGGALHVTLNQSLSPRITVDPLYLDMLTQAKETEVALYLRSQMESLNRLERAIAMRSTTLAAVARAVTDRQAPFFLSDTASLRPLSMEEVSQQLGLHSSTISRAVQGKYLRCARGTFPLRHFFARYVHGAEDSGGQLSNAQIRQRIQALIQEEDPAAPLSDQQLLCLLQEEGISVSRRTIAKYRQELGIPGTYARKKV